MEAVDFEEANIRIAEGQKEYLTLPAYYDQKEGSLCFCFKLTPDEVNRIKATDEIWFKVLTFGNSMQPIFLSTNKEDMNIKDKENGEG